MNNNLRTILVIEDNELNREILCEILQPYYNILQAENGKTGLQLLEQNKKIISLILLDIQMPVMNGYEFLDAVRDKPDYSKIPIIVTTSSAAATDEIHCLENGATDFVAKPYNPDVVIKRAAGMIRLSEASSMINKVERDDITGAYNKDFFFLHVDSALGKELDSQYDMLCLQIDSFKLLCDRFDEKTRNDFFAHLAASMLEAFNCDGIFGKIEHDVLAIFCPHQEKAFFETGAELVRRAIKSSPIPTATVRIGLYQNLDREAAASVLCENTLLSIDGIGYQYGKQISRYDEKLRSKLLRYQFITDEMESAIDDEQFVVYYQPKHDLANNRTGGAEALIRWIHPRLGFISPGDFVPLFEKNGFITRLDYYVVERVCRDIREWLDNGSPVVPISLNLSRVDFEDESLVQTIEEIVNRHSVPREYIHLEVTESAYTENVDGFISTLTELRGRGFPIELDDFGSGYSSLGLLNDIEMDVLKLDMSLVRNILESEKQLLILNHILSIASDLGAKVVAEGVETAAQSAKLKELGCTYAQGYYYSKPIPKEQFEAYLLKQEDVNQ